MKWYWQTSPLARCTRGQASLHQRGGLRGALAVAKSEKQDARYTLWFPLHMQAGCGTFLRIWYYSPMFLFLAGTKEAFKHTPREENLSSAVSTTHCSWFYSNSEVTQSPRGIVYIQNETPRFVNYTLVTLFTRWKANTFWSPTQGLKTRLRLSWCNIQRKSPWNKFLNADVLVLTS